ncbi:ABC transporter ATP-binding protein [Nesterenkonia halobia]|uniref:ABC transporter ATP-binding protein n=2 Tax=Nesterenkonia halobia TaxID=37922 RepID=A0ABP6R660_9MICC
MGLTRRYRGAAAVDQLDLRLVRGEVYGFLGPNGAGKTTTMRMLMGLVRPTAGSIRLFGRPVGPASLSRVSALIEAPAFRRHLSGRRNLQALAHHARVPRERVGKALDAVRLADRADEPVTAFSMGMTQRLGLAAVLLKDPRLLILDEPANGLDPAGIVEMRRLLRRLADEGRTVLLSSHLMGEVEQICDRVGIIRRGEMVMESTVAQLRSGGALHVLAEPQESARRLLAGRVGSAAVRQDGERLLIATGPYRAAELNELLIESGHAVAELSWCEPDLEQMFLRLTEDHDDP